MGRTLRQALHLIGRSNRSRWALLVALALATSALEMVGAILVYLLLGLIADPSGDIDLPLIGDVRSLFGTLDGQGLMLVTVLTMGGFFVLRSLVQVGGIYVQRRVAENAGAKLSNKLIEGYLHWPYSAHLRRTSSELIRNGHQAVQALVGQLFVPMIRLVAECFLTLGLLVVLVSIAPTATVIAVPVVAGAAMLVLLVVQPRLKRLGRTVHQMQRETLGILQQSFHGIRDIKVLGRERHFARLYGRHRLELARASYLRATITQTPSAVMELSLIGFILVFFAFSIASGTTDSVLPVLGLFAYAGLRLQPSIQRIAHGLNDIKFSTAPVEDLSADLALVEAQGNVDGRVAPLPFDHALELENICHRYEGSAVDSLSGMNLTIKPGEQIGICGPTGGGKTTLVDVMTGLLKPTAGRVLVDECDIHTDTRAWQQNLGVVPQMVFLLDDTLKRNIALGVRDRDVDEAALLEAVDLAQLTHFVEALPHGLDTEVGERGIRISGGQRQRIAIARALYRRPSVLIFDEGTSALDNATEAELMKAIERLRGHHTVILVAHRLSTVKESDRILFVEDGRVTGEGSYEELKAAHPSFQAMAGAGGS